MKKTLLLVVVALLALMGVATTQAQMTPTPIQIGEVVEGTLASADEIQVFTFSAVAGDVLVVRYGDFEFESDLSDPTVQVQNADGIPLVNTDGFSNVEVMVEIPADGDYRILVGTDDTPGDFTLEIVQPQILEADTVVEGTITNEQVAFYAIRADAPFNLIYQRTGGGAFFPAVQLYVNSEFSGALSTTASMAGEEMTAGSMAIEPSEPKVYIVKVEQTLLTFSFGDESASYTLTLK